MYISLLRNRLLLINRFLLLQYDAFLFDRGYMRCLVADILSLIIYNIISNIIACSYNPNITVLLITKHMSTVIYTLHFSYIYRLLP